MSDVIQLRPEVMELVREIAQRPDSVLLRVKPGAEMCALREDRSWLTGSESSLSRAERHLVEVYREEVAYALRAAAWLLIATSPEGVVRVTRGIGPSRTIPVPTAREVAALASKGLIARKMDGQADATSASLQAIASPEAILWPRPEVLCVLAHRLVPSCNGRILAGIAYALASRPEAARTSFSSGLEFATSVELAAAAWQGIAGLEEQRDQWLRARLAAHRARTLHPGLASAWIIELWCSIRLGEIEPALFAAAALEEIAAQDLSSVAEHGIRIEKTVSALKRSWNREADRTLHTVWARSAQNVGRILHALV